LGVSECGDVVDGASSCGEGLSGDLWFDGVYGKGDGDFAGDFFQDGDDSAQFLAGGDLLCPGAAGLPAHIDDVGAVLDELEASICGGLGVKAFATVGEGVGGDVDSSHEEGSGTELEGVLAEAKKGGCIGGEGKGFVDLVGDFFEVEGLVLEVVEESAIMSFCAYDEGVGGGLAHGEAVVGYGHVASDGEHGLFEDVRGRGREAADFCQSNEPLRRELLYAFGVNADFFELVGDLVGAFEG
jgi:hypothetical protein